MGQNTAWWLKSEEGDQYILYKEAVNDLINDIGTTREQAEEEMKESYGK